MRIKINNFLFLFLGLIGFNATPLMAADNIFLCSDSLEGEATDPRYPGCSDVLAWSWGASTPIDSSGGGGGAGKVNFQDLSVTKNVDKSSPDIMLRLASGVHISKIELIIDNCASECANSAYYKVIMENVLISSVNLGGSAGADRPTEQVSLNYQKIQWCYSPADPKSGLGAELCNGWDIPSNTRYP